MENMGMSNMGSMPGISNMGPMGTMGNMPNMGAMMQPHMMSGFTWDPNMKNWPH